MGGRPFAQSLKFAWAGLSTAWRTQRNFRRHIMATAALVVFVPWLGLTRSEQVLIVLAAALVIVSELVNTVIETVVDLCTREYHPLAEQAKDMAAAVVLTSAATALIIGIIILGPPLLRLAHELVLWVAGAAAR